jgi:hypothetical protein
MPSHACGDHHAQIPASVPIGRETIAQLDRRRRVV